MSRKTYEDLIDTVALPVARILGGVVFGVAVAAICSFIVLALFPPGT